MEIGERIPALRAQDQNGASTTLSEFAGRATLVYFYPKADTPGCTQQACLLRDLEPQIGATRIVGISPDKPAALKRFHDKYGLGFTLLSDIDHAIAEAFGVWQEKKNYGKVYMGVVRSAFLFDELGVLTHAWPKISPKDTPVRLLEALEER